MKEREIDEILNRAAQPGAPLDPALLDRITGSIGKSLQPVRPMPPRWILTSALATICVAVAVAGAARSGFAGVQNLVVWKRALIFPLLGLLTWIAAAAWVGEMIPGSRRRLGPGALLVAASSSLLAVFAILFRDSTTNDFLHQGLICLSAGLGHAIPAAVVGWFVVRRGFAVNPTAAGLVAGIFAGMAGVSMLELHCANVQMLHVMLWHTGVIPLSGGAGAFLARRFCGPSRANASPR